MARKVKTPVPTGPRHRIANPPVDTNKSQDAESSAKMLRIFHLSLTLIPALFLLRLVKKYADNIPVKDDYEAILNFLIRYKLADAGEKIKLCFSLHSEHRIVTSRLLYILWYELTGTVSFKAFILIGNWMLIPIFLVCAHFIRRFTPKYWYIPAFIMSLLIFDPSSYENNYFAMAGVANFGIIMFFMLSLYFYSKDTTKALIAAAFCQVLCIYSNGNGMVGAFAIALATFFFGDRRRMITATAIFVVFTALYFVSYHKPDSVENLRGTPAQIVPFFIRMLGSHFLYEQSFYAGLVIILLFIVCFPISKKLKPERNAVPIIAILLFALISVAIVSVFRSGKDPLHSYTSRYFIYTKMMTGILICFIFFKLSYLKNRKYFWSFNVVTLIAFTGLFYYGMLWGESNIRLEKRRRLVFQYYFKKGKEDDPSAKPITDKACELGIYCIEENRENATYKDYYP